MKRINFLIKLFKEKIIKIVEPSEVVKDSYIAKSKNSLISASILLKSKQIEDSVPLSYYSMYYMLTALFYKIGIKCENHSASIILLKELFNLDNSKISFAKTERVDKQYYVDFKITTKQVEDLIDIAKEFNNILYNFMEDMTNKDIEKYRKEIKEVLDFK